MSHALLSELLGYHAFNPAPTRSVIAAYHVASVELGVERNREAHLERSARQQQRTIIVGESGSGKTSLIEFVLGADAEGVAPIPVRLSPEPDEIVTSTQLVAQHIIQTLIDQRHNALAEYARQDALEKGSTHRSGSRKKTKGALSGSWMGAGLSLEIERQVEVGVGMRRSTASTLEQVEQLLTSISKDGYVPVLVFDDTDRWFTRDNLGPARTFFETVVRELRELSCGLVVTAHDTYLNDGRIERHINDSFEDHIAIPPLPSSEALSAVIRSRLRAHIDDNVHVSEILTDEARQTLWAHYRNSDAASVRDVFTTLHVALTEACDDRLDRITDGLILTSGRW